MSFHNLEVQHIIHTSKERTTNLAHLPHRLKYFSVPKTPTLDGRATWYVAHMTGRLEETLQPEQESSEGILDHGGLAEAIGGRVYELREPRRLVAPPKRPQPLPPPCSRPEWVLGVVRRWVASICVDSGWSFHCARHQAQFKDIKGGSMVNGSLSSRKYKR